MHSLEGSKVSFSFHVCTSFSPRYKNTKTIFSLSQLSLC